METKNRTTHSYLNSTYITYRTRLKNNHYHHRHTHACTRIHTVLANNINAGIHATRPAIVSRLWHLRWTITIGSSCDHLCIAFTTACLRVASDFPPKSGIFLRRMPFRVRVHRNKKASSVSNFEPTIALAGTQVRDCRLQGIARCQKGSGLGEGMGYSQGSTGAATMQRQHLRRSRQHLRVRLLFPVGSSVGGRGIFACLIVHVLFALSKHVCSVCSFCTCLGN